MPEAPTPEQLAEHYSERITKLATSKQLSWLRDSKFGYALFEDLENQTLFVVFDKENYEFRKTKEVLDMSGVLGKAAEATEGAFTPSGWTSIQLEVPYQFFTWADAPKEKRDVFVMEIKETSDDADVRSLSKNIHKSMGEAILQTDLIPDCSTGLKGESISYINQLQKNHGFYTSLYKENGSPVIAVVVDVRRMLKDVLLHQHGPRAAVENFISSSVNTPEGSSPFSLEFDREDDFASYSLPSLDNILKNRDYSPNEEFPALVFWLRLKEGVFLPLHSADRIREHIESLIQSNTQDVSEVEGFEDYTSDDLESLSLQQLLDISTKCNEMDKKERRAYVLTELHELGIDTEPEDDEEYEDDENKEDDD